MGVYLNQSLLFQEEIEDILRKKACGIKTLYSIRDFFPETIRLLLLKALLISHLHYRILCGLVQLKLSIRPKRIEELKRFSIKQSTIDHQTSGSKLLSFRFDKNKTTSYFWKWKNNLTSPFLDLQLDTGKIRKESKTENLYFKILCRSGFFKEMYTCETPCQKLNAKKCLFSTAKLKIKNFLLAKSNAEINVPEAGKKCLSNYRFKERFSPMKFSDCLLF